MVTREDKILWLKGRCDNENSCSSCPICHLELCGEHLFDQFSDDELDKCVRFWKASDEIENDNEDKSDGVRSALYMLIDMIDYYNRISKLRNCNDCGSRKVCKYIPKPGEHTRINCPLWSEEKNDNN